MTKTTTEKIESIKIQQQQLENQKKKLLQQQKEADRKARTKRLIERGALLESMIPSEYILTNDQLKVLLQKTVGSDFALRILGEITRASKIAIPKISEVQPSTES